MQFDPLLLILMSHLAFTFVKGDYVYSSLQMESNFGHGSIGALLNSC